MLSSTVRHIYRTGRPYEVTNFKLGTQMEHGDPYQRQLSHVLAHKSKVKSYRNMKIGRKVGLTEIAGHG